MSHRQGRFVRRPNVRSLSGWWLWEEEWNLFCLFMFNDQSCLFLLIIRVYKTHVNLPTVIKMIGIITYDYITNNEYKVRLIFPQNQIKSFKQFNYIVFKDVVAAGCCWRLKRLKYGPTLFRTSQRWLPCCTIFPPCNTLIVSAFLIVDNRWAITTVVRFVINRSNACCT